MSFFGDIRDSINFTRYGDYKLEEMGMHIRSGDKYYDNGVLYTYKVPYEPGLFRGGETFVTQRYAINCGCDGDNKRFSYERLANFTSHDSRSPSYTFYKVYKPDDFDGHLCRTVPNKHGKQSEYLQIIGEFDDKGNVKVKPQFQEEIRSLPDNVKQAIGIREINHTRPQNVHRQQSLMDRTNTEGEHRQQATNMRYIVTNYEPNPNLPRFG